MTRRRRTHRTGSRRTIQVTGVSAPAAARHTFWSRPGGRRGTARLSPSGWKRRARCSSTAAGRAAGCRPTPPPASRSCPCPSCGIRSGSGWTRPCWTSSAPCTGASWSRRLPAASRWSRAATSCCASARCPRRSRTWTCWRSACPLRPKRRRASASSFPAAMRLQTWIFSVKSRLPRTCENWRDPIRSWWTPASGSSAPAPSMSCSPSAAGTPMPKRSRTVCRARMSCTRSSACRWAPTRTKPIPRFLPFPAPCCRCRSPNFITWARTASSSKPSPCCRTARHGPRTARSRRSTPTSSCRTRRSTCPCAGARTTRCGLKTAPFPPRGGSATSTS